MEIENQGDRYVYADNGADILGVAHLDSVDDGNWCNWCEVGNDTVVYSPRLDDRLGVYIITNLLQKLGVRCDWLLTEGEETGASTALLFEPPAGKDYKWMFQFDRRGTDAVMYQYETTEYRQIVEASGVRVSTGSYSDISSLEHLGCVGVNWGCGYEDYHSDRSHFWLNDLVLQVHRFLRFYKANRYRPLNWDASMASRTHSLYPYGQSQGYGTHGVYLNGMWRDLPRDAAEGTIFMGEYGCWVKGREPNDWRYTSNRQPGWDRLQERYEAQEAAQKALPPSATEGGNVVELDAARPPARVWQPAYRPVDATLEEYELFLIHSDRTDLTDGQWRDLCELEESLYSEGAV